MANQVTGRLVAIGKTETLQTKSGSAFKRRDFLLDARTFDPYTGELSQYENLLPLDVGGERCADLDHFHVGDTVTVSFALQGRTWKTADGQEKRLTSVRCYRIEAYGASPQQLSTAQAPVPQPTTAAPAQVSAPRPQPTPQPAHQPTPDPWPGHAPWETGGAPF